MEERKTTAIVLGIIGLVIIFFTVILPEIRLHSTQTLSYKNCTVHFENVGGLVDDSYRAGQNKLAHCLCNSYTRHRDTAVAGQIIKIYRQYSSPFYQDSAHLDNNIDSLIKYKSAVFDTLVYLD